MIRKLTLIFPLLAVACTTPELPGGFEDEQSWFDARVSEGAAGQAAPATIPDKSPALSGQAIDASAQAVLGARDSISGEERAMRPAATDTESYAEEARERASPPPPID